MSRRFSEEAQRLREQLEVERSDAEIERGRRRLLAAIERPKPKRAWLLVPALAALIALLFLLRPRNEGLTIASGEACVKQAEHSISVDPCQVEVELAIGRETEDLAFVAGRARFRVKKREQKRFAITVSHGVIVVIGTRFIVEQRRSGGRVEIEEGIVEFRWSDGSAPERLERGESLEWPRSIPPPPPVKTETATASAPPRRPPAKKSAAPEKKVSSKELMQRLFQLKSQRRFEEAIELLSAGSRRRDFTEIQRERLSFELGIVLRQSGRAEEACQHFREHLHRFPSSPRKNEIADTCPE